MNMHAEPAAALRRHVGVRPQGGPARVGHRPAQGRLRARRPRRGRQRHPLRRVRAGRARPRSSSRPRSSASSSTAPALTAVIDELKQLEHEGYHFEAADGSLELLMRRATGWAQDVLQARVVPGDRRRRHDQRPGTTPRPPSRCVVDGERHRRHGRGQRPGQRARRRAAPGRSASATRSCERSTSPTTRCACSTRPRAPAP